YCLATSALRGNQRLIAVVMGAESEKSRADANQELLNYGFRFFESHKLYETSKPLATPQLWKGDSATVALGVNEDVLVTLARGRYADLKASMELPAQLIAPLQKGQKVGSLKVELDGKSLVERDIVVLADVAEGGFFKRLGDGVMLWFESSDATNTAVPAQAQ
ncbi:MAG: serine-type D-Ala-D-Ala carboxypeptidase, partial [Dokdonella sp.]